jgi:hypothetical protein
MNTEVEATGFDYESLGDLAGPIEGIAKRIKAKMKRSVRDIIEIGQDLQSAHNMLAPKGMFRDWIARAFDMSEASARRFMNVAARFGGECQIETLTPSVIYLLSTASDESVNETLAAAKAGPVTVAEVKEIIERNDATEIDDTEESECQIETPNDDGNGLDNDREPAEQSGQAAGHEVAARDPHGKPAQWITAISGSIDSVRERFDANAEPGYESAMFLSDWAKARKSFDRFMATQK